MKNFLSVRIEISALKKPLIACTLAYIDRSVPMAAVRLIKLPALDSVRFKNKFKNDKDLKLTNYFISNIFSL